MKRIFVPLSLIVTGFMLFPAVPGFAPCDNGIVKQLPIGPTTVYLADRGSDGDFDVVYRERNGIAGLQSGDAPDLLGGMGDTCVTSHDIASDDLLLCNDPQYCIPW